MPSDHRDHLRIALEHLSECKRSLRRVLDVLDVEPEMDADSAAADIEPLQFDDTVDDNQEGQSK